MAAILSRRVGGWGGGGGGVGVGVGVGGWGVGVAGGGGGDEFKKNNRASHWTTIMLDVLVRFHNNFSHLGSYFVVNQSTGP